MKKHFNSLKSKISGDVDLKELLQGSAISFLMRIINIGLNFLLIWLFAQYGGAHLVGLFSLSLVVLNISVLISNVGLDTATLKLTSEYNSDNNLIGVRRNLYRAISISFPFSIIIGVLVFFGANTISTYVFHNPELSRYLKIIAFGIPFMSFLLISSESMRGLKRILEYSLFNRGFYYFISIIGFSICFLLPDKNLELPFIIFIISVGISALLCYRQWLKHTHIAHEDKDNKNTSLLSRLDLLTLSYPMLLSSAFNFIQGWSDTIILGMYRPAEEIGIYNVAFRFTTLAQLGLLAVNSISGPKFAEFHRKGETKNLRKTAQRAAKLTFFSSAPLLIIYLLIPNILLSIYGSEFVAGQNVMRFISVGRFFSAMSGSVGLILLMTGYQKIFQNIILISSISNIVLSFILIPIYGINGAAFSNMVGLILANVFCLYIIYKKYNFIVLYFPFLKKK